MKHNIFKVLFSWLLSMFLWVSNKENIVLLDKHLQNTGGLINK